MPFDPSFNEPGYYSQPYSTAVPGSGGRGMADPVSAGIAAGGQLAGAGISAAGNKAAAKSAERSNAAALEFAKQQQAQRQANYTGADKQYTQRLNDWQTARQALLQRYGVDISLGSPSSPAAAAPIEDPAISEWTSKLSKLKNAPMGMALLKKAAAGQWDNGVSNPAGTEAARRILGMSSASGSANPASPQSRPMMSGQSGNSIADLMQPTQQQAAGPADLQNWNDWSRYGIGPRQQA